MTTRQNPTHGATSRPVPVPNWTKLSHNEEITVRLNGEHLASGRVDMLSIDGSILWLIQNDGRRRTLFLHRDGVQIFRGPAPATFAAADSAPITMIP